MKPILLLTDFSQKSQKSLDYARWLWKKEPCTFYIMHAYGSAKCGLDAIDLLDPYEVYEQQTANLCSQEMQKIKKEIEEVSRHNPLHQFYFVISEKNITAAINEVVKKSDIEIIVLGINNVTSKVKRLVSKVKEIPFLAVPNTKEKRLCYHKTICKDNISKIRNVINNGFPIYMNGYKEQNKKESFVHDIEHLLEKFHTVLLGSFWSIAKFL